MSTVSLSEFAVGFRDPSGIRNAGRHAPKKVHEDVAPTEAVAQNHTQQTSTGEPQCVCQVEVLRDFNDARKNEHGHGKRERRPVQEGFDQVVEKNDDQKITEKRPDEMNV